MQISTDSFISVSDFDFSLPADLIADRPITPKESAKLMVYHEDSGKIEHRVFADVGEYLSNGDLLVFNNSKVFPSRLFGKKLTGGKAELLLLSPEPIDQKYLVMLRTNGKKNIGDKFIFGILESEILECFDRGIYTVQFKQSSLEVKNYFLNNALLAIPPYIRKGLSDEQDKIDYQTVYAKEEGSVAAPTAGLHFSKELLQSLSKQNIFQAEITLHVGLGTFLPIETDNILDHKMHKEYYVIDYENQKKIKHCQGRTFAVGTTALRALESAYLTGNWEGNTDLFLYPGKSVQSIQGLITNFHLPKSSLLLLVSAIIGKEKCLELYDIAIKNRYRFFSYGDAMLILRSSHKSKERMQ